MKNLICVVFIIFSLISLQKRECIYFLYKGDLKNMKVNSIIKIDNQDFKILNEKFEEVLFEKVKAKLYTFDEFIIKNKSNKFPDYYNNYKIYVYIPIDSKKGYKIKAEKVWIIDEPIE